jgi:hypothetical protein
MTLQDLDLDKLTPASLWSALDADTRKVAARALYAKGWEDDGSRLEANHAIASTLRFREVAVRRMPLDKRVDYLSRVVRPEDNLASALLMALHFLRRTELLGAFLDRLGIPQENGVIDSEFDLEPPPPEKLTEAIAGLRGNFPDTEIDVYLATLLAIDPDSWGGLAEVLGAREA